MNGALRRRGSPNGGRASVYRLPLMAVALFAAGVAERPADADACQTGEAVRAEVELITQMEHERTAAGGRKDVRSVQAMTEPDYTQIDTSGVLLGAEATFARMAGNSIRIQSNSLTDIVVRICSDTAIVTGKGHPRGVLNGQPYNLDTAYSRIYLKRNGQWRVIHFQQTPIVQ